MGSTWPEVGSQRTAPLELKKGVELHGRYVIAELCGVGSYATVWRATDKDQNRDVAIKRLIPQHGNSSRLAEALIAEAEKVKKLTGHKNIVQVYETFSVGGEGFLAMEYVDGGTLNDQLRQHAKQNTWIDQDEALDYIKQMLEGLIFAHSSGLYHRDIKPSNILISKLGTVKLADFGLAKAMFEEGLKNPADGLAWTGTPYYMSYEQASGEELNHQTDIMSAGIVAYLLLTGHHPFNHPSGVLAVKELIGDKNYPCPKPLGWGGKPLNPVLAEVLHRLLQKDKLVRYQSLVEPLTLLSKDDSVQCRRCTSSNPKSNLYCGQCGNPLSPAGLALQAEPGSELAEETAEQLNAMGFERTRNNDWDGAIRLYRKALDKDPRYAGANANLGFALNRKGQYGEAIQAANRGLESAQDAGIKHRLFDVRGFAKSCLNDAQGAIADFTSSLNLRSNPRVYVHRAESKAAIGDIPMAYEDVLAALEIDPDYYPASRLQLRLDKLL